MEKLGGGGGGSWELRVIRQGPICTPLCMFDFQFASLARSQFVALWCTLPCAQVGGKGKYLCIIKARDRPIRFAYTS